MHTGARTRNRRGHRRAQPLEPPAHPLQQRAQLAKIAHHLALGPRAQLLRIAIELALVQGVDEQVRMLDHAFALLTLRALLVAEPDR